VRFQIPPDLVVKSQAIDIIDIILQLIKRQALVQFDGRLLLDSRVVDLTMSYNPIFVTVYSLKPLFFNGLKN